MNLDPWKWNHTSQTLSRIENLGNSISSTISINQKNLNTIVIKSPNLNPESIELIKKIVFRWISAEWNPNKIIELSKIAKKRNQTISQMAIAWVLRHPTMTSALIGARTVKQLNECLDSLKNLKFSKHEIKRDFL